jgi:Ca2+-binding EF-hand superfamily protein
MSFDHSIDNAFLAVEVYMDEIEFTTPRKLAELEEAMDRIGTDDSACLDSSRVPTLLRSIGMDVTAAELDPFIIECSSSFGKVSFDQVVGIIKLRVKEERRAKALRKGLELLDKKKDGAVSCKDAIMLMEVLLNREVPVEHTISEQAKEMIIQHGKLEYNNIDINKLVRSF